MIAQYKARAAFLESSDAWAYKPPRGLMRASLLLAPVLFAVVEFAATRPATASCLPNRNATNYTQDVYRFWYPPPGYRTDNDGLVGSFWKLGSYASANQGACTPSLCNWIYFDLGGIILDANFIYPQVVGCPTTRLAVVAEDISMRNSAYGSSAADSSNPFVRRLIGFSLSTIMTYPVGAYLSSCMPPRWNHQSPR
jgi:hypothetical protein